MHNDQKGAAHLLLVLVIVLVAIGAVGFFVMQRMGEGKGAVSAVPATCGTEFYDTHAHLDDSELPGKLAKVMQDNGVSCAVMFVQMNQENYDEDAEILADDLGEAPPVFVPFFDVVMDKNSRPDTAYLQKLANEFGGKFKGFGEFALYRPDIGGSDLTAEPWTSIYQFAGDNNLPVMIHPGLNPQDRTGLEAMMAAHPNTKFLIHGFEFGPDGYAELLKTYPNLYYTLDTATLLKTEGMGPHLMYPNEGGDVQKFLREYAQYKDELLQRAKTEWSKVVLAAPDRVMWGTDASFDWHTDPAVYAKLIEFSKEFTATLPADTQPKYTHQNAASLLGDKAIKF